MSQQNFSIDPQAIADCMQTAARADHSAVTDILQKADELKGLNPDDAALLLHIRSDDIRQEVFNCARRVKERIYGKRMVLFAPLYISDQCANECSYCAFRVGNHSQHRRVLKQEEIAAETRALTSQGHRRLLLVAGEHPAHAPLDYILDAIDTIYRVSEKTGNIRRININIAPLEIEDFRRLHQAEIGTYQIFQETYDPQVYAQVHTRGKKRDFAWRLGAMDRAMEAGIDDVGIGALFGLADWRYDVLALLHHARHLDQRFGVGPHTISVPRLEPASGATWAPDKSRVSDEDFRLLVAVLRLAVPYTGIILSTRESAEMRRSTFALGVSQISAGSRTNPGGYSEGEQSGQFELGDHRSLAEVVSELAHMGYIPSFCTACYRMGRTGADFMDLARPGDIRRHCDPNALASLLEYSLDYGSDETCRAADKAIHSALDEMDDAPARTARKLIERVRAGHRDQYC